MARVTRLELAASGVTGRRSNQLSYTRMVRGAVYIKTTQLRQVFFDRFSKKNARALFGGLITRKTAQKQKSASEKIAALILCIIPNQGGNGASDET